MRRLTEDLATGLLVLAAVAVAAAAVHREFFRAEPEVPDGGPVFIDAWEEMVEAGVLIGDASAEVKVIVFSDLECPFCARFHAEVQEVRVQHGERISMVFVHFPLQQHEMARSAARAAECAGSLGRFEPFLDLVFEEQDSIGVKSWATFAGEAGVEDLRTFAECEARIGPTPLIDRGLFLGSELGIRGTPTVVINGWKFRAPPIGSLTQAVELVMAGERPYGRN